MASNLNVVSPFFLLVAACERGRVQAIHATFLAAFVAKTNLNIIVGVLK